MHWLTVNYHVVTLSFTLHLQPLDMKYKHVLINSKLLWCYIKFYIVFVISSLLTLAIIRDVMQKYKHVLVNSKLQWCYIKFYIVFTTS